MKTEIESEDSEHVVAKAQNKRPFHEALTSSTKSRSSLSIEEEISLIGAAKAGDSAAMQRLMSEFMYLASYHAQQLASNLNRRYDVDNLFQTGVLKIHEMVFKYNPDEGYRFATYLNTCIYHEILREAQAQTKHTAKGGESTADYESVLPPENRSSADSIANRAFIDMLFRAIDDEHCFVLEQRAQDKTYEQIAEAGKRRFPDKKWSRKRCSSVHKDAQEAGRALSSLLSGLGKDVAKPPKRKKTKRRKTARNTSD